MMRLLFVLGMLAGLTQTAAAADFGRLMEQGVAAYHAANADAVAAAKHDMAQWGRAGETDAERREARDRAARLGAMEAMLRLDLPEELRLAYGLRLCGGDSWAERSDATKNEPCPGTAMLFWRWRLTLFLRHPVATLGGDATGPLSALGLVARAPHDVAGLGPFDAMQFSPLKPF